MTQPEENSEIRDINRAIPEREQGTPGAIDTSKKDLTSTEDLMTSREFFDMLRLRHADNAQEIDRQIEKQGLQDLAVIMSDSSGFSRKTHQYGILPFLSVMIQCYDQLVGLVAKNRGTCLAEGADNLLAVFADPADAVQASIEMHQWLQHANQGRPDVEQFNICIGIHFGPAIRLKDNVFGDTVNIAAKIGEDLAGKNEILITHTIAEQVKDRFRCEYSRSTELGGRVIELYQVIY